MHSFRNRFGTDGTHCASVVALNAVGCRKAEKSAEERSGAQKAQAQVRKRAQKGNNSKGAGEC